MAAVGTCVHLFLSNRKFGAPAGQRISQNKTVSSFAALLVLLLGFRGWVFSSLSRPSLCLSSPFCGSLTFALSLPRCPCQSNGTLRRTHTHSVCLCALWFSPSLAWFPCVHVAYVHSSSRPLGTAVRALYACLAVFLC